MQKELASFIEEIRDYQMPRWKEKERSIDDCLRIVSSWSSASDYVTVNDYIERSVNDLLLQAIERFHPETFFELQKVLDLLDEEDWIFPQVETDLIYQNGPKESLIILEQCEEHLEEDTGIWETKKDARDILSIQAYFTYRNALQDRLRQKVEKAMEELQTEALSAYQHAP